MQMDLLGRAPDEIAPATGREYSSDFIATVQADILPDGTLGEHRLLVAHDALWVVADEDTTDEDTSSSKNRDAYTEQAMWDGYASSIGKPTVIRKASLENATEAKIKS
jgi:hypothetical protein